MSSHTDEMRYWRNFAMRRGHERLDPDRVYNAIRDIYENDLLHGDIHDVRHQQTGGSRIRTPQDPTHDHSRSHPHAPTSNRAHAPRPVVPPEERVTPIIPSGTSFHLPPLTHLNEGIRIDSHRHHPHPNYMRSIFPLVHWSGLLTRALLNTAPMCQRLLLDGQKVLNLDKSLGRGGGEDLHRHRHRRCRDVPRRRPGTGHSTGLFRLHSLHPMRVASHIGVLVCGHRCRGRRTRLYD
ncbi:hypothetical protein PISMIDRAFT_278603 [Pisolithus microcarpus 441]|uniref:Unplaced genomic scaffold scaffold_184, whole genome shotgun sequence n=1 Tax=Pisolithus microcarpus 441 TaxID=765257 RepID=A0A0C9XUJ7_9AGAM|nr:hypothetical protein PISMIDRAFT_278603 [Pisolithus microcarpus 441]